MNYIITTPRLALRKFKPQDAAAFYQMNLDPDVIKYTGDKSFKNKSEALDFILNYDAYTHFGFGRWAVIDKANNKFIGFCGFKRNEENIVDLGFRLVKGEWNKGKATEAALACLHHGFMKLEFDMVIGRVVRENIASIRVLEKTGMKFWKTGSCEGMENALYYKITKEAFLKNNKS